MDEEVHIVTRIFDKRIVNNKIEYMVSFKGLHIGLSEWVPVECLKNCQREIDHYEAKIKGLKTEGGCTFKRPSKFANDYDFILMKGKMSKEDFKRYETKDEYESESDYEELKLDYLEAKKRMELEKERKQLIEVDKFCDKKKGEIERKKLLKNKSKITKKKFASYCNDNDLSDSSSVHDNDQHIYCNESDKKSNVEVVSNKINLIETKNNIEIKEDDSKVNSGKSSDTDDNECILRSSEKHRRSILRLDSSESENEVELQKKDDNRKSTKTFMEHLDTVHTIDLENFLTFLEVNIVENKKIICFLTKDKNFYNINEDEIPLKMKPMYMDFLFKKGLPS
ncbi:Chromo domain/shadow and Chromo domain-like and Chromo domain-containing protein [Strongyloides ratti]|uniref:Chromo domain/shadow and Chromo domain-like and Chromo domain-containing protein n=1 Tax=Strongyloides ratti TaxID=34506 RepID=A0A090MYT1_STRRB|nr:Chromo domain/shadow and Chromo domain-like and Chromo domain-containing protein [Strongyloides ratti]CEF67724.1 Chromo domain/shadow and Chromo domain-like and Chromo domain-containing protein [Strongyloides ratti]